ncbi:ZP domain-containing protein-like [Rhinatrema bivittatum]|uniref:ZP domain-containing protein-like n=1 Tax=Rhinatrema bivittatum TaxID=194408 RepID=UPI00112ED219|nr:ZP domain-containing protein-like [Rhinatrema bivittatum]
MVQQPNGENRIQIDIRTITLNTEDGNFSVSLMLYKDTNFEDMWTTVPFLTLEDNIFVRVNMVPGHLIIRLEKCWATPTNDPSHAIQYTFIEDSCKVSLDETLSIIMNGVAPEAMFRIQMFKFVGPSHNDIFLHCTVQICHNTAALCKPNCPNYGRVARIRRETGPTHTVSYGPIRRKLPETGEVNLNTGNLPPVDSMVLGGILLAVLVITAIFGKLLYQERRAYPAQAPLILSNMHSSEAAS